MRTHLARIAQQTREATIRRDLNQLRISWGDDRPDGMCDSLLDQLLTVCPHITRERL